MITLAPANPEPTKKNAIVLNGRTIGEMEEYQDNRGLPRFHAVIRLKSGDFACHLAQGHGDTADQAITNAVQESLGDARRFIDELTTLGREIAGEQVPS